DDLCDLAGDRTDRARGARNDDGLTRLRLADLDQAEVGRETGHTEHAESGREGRERRIDLTYTLAVRQRILLPAEESFDEITRGEVCVLRLDHASHRASDHHLTELDRRRVRAGRVHAAAHVGIDGKIKDPDQDLARRRTLDRRLDERKVRLAREACRPG